MPQPGLPGQEPAGQTASQKDQQVKQQAEQQNLRQTDFPEVTRPEDEQQPASTGQQTAAADDDARQSQAEEQSPDRVTGRVTDQEGPVNRNATASGAPEEDKVITWNFVSDLARFVVDNYYPPGTHPNAGSRGLTTLSVKKLNMHYGTDMTGLDAPAQANGDLLQAREEVYQYVLSPMILRIMYALYANRFIDSLVEQGQRMEKSFIEASPVQTRPMNREEINGMLLVNADWARGLADTLARAAAMDDLRLRVENYRNAVQETLQANEAFIQALALEEERREQVEQAGVASDELKQLFNEARNRKDQAGAAYGEAIRRREKIKADLAARLTPSADDKRMTPDARVYVSMWVARRLVDTDATREALKVSASLLHKLADRMQARGEPRG